MTSRVIASTRHRNTLCPRITAKRNGRWQVIFTQVNSAG
jgi:hypothetical protein